MGDEAKPNPEVAADGRGTEQTVDQSTTAQTTGNEQAGETPSGIGETFKKFMPFILGAGAGLIGLMLGGPLIGVILALVGGLLGPMAINALSSDKTQTNSETVSPDATGQGKNEPGKGSGKDEPAQDKDKSAGPAIKQPFASTKQEELGVEITSELGKDNKTEQTMIVDGLKVKLVIDKANIEKRGDDILVKSATLHYVDHQGVEATKAIEFRRPHDIADLKTIGMVFDPKAVAEMNNEVAATFRSWQEEAINKEVASIKLISGDANSYGVTMKDAPKTSYLAHVDYQSGSVIVQNLRGEKVGEIRDINPEIMHNQHALARRVGLGMVEIHKQAPKSIRTKTSFTTTDVSNTDHEVKLVKEEEKKLTEPAKEGKLLINGREATYKLETEDNDNKAVIKKMTLFFKGKDNEPLTVEVPVSTTKVLGETHADIKEGKFATEFKQDDSVIVELAERAMQERDKDIRTLQSRGVSSIYEDENNLIMLESNTQEYGKHNITVERVGNAGDYRYVAKVRDLADEHNGEVKVLGGAEFASLTEATNESLHHIHKHHGKVENYSYRAIDMKDVNVADLPTGSMPTPAGNPIAALGAGLGN